MKRLVIDARESGSSSGRYTDKVIEHMHSIKLPYKIILLAKPHRVDYLKKVAPSYIIEVTPYKEFTFAEQFLLLKKILSLKPDLVFFPFVQQPVLYFGKTITTMQDLTTIRYRNPSKNWLVFTIKREIYKLVNLWAAKKSALLLTPTEFVKQDVVNYCRVNPEKITVTLEAADPIKEASEPVDYLVGQEFIMYVGRPMPHKNLPRLVEAFATLQKSRPNLKLVLAGKKDSMYQIVENDVRAKGIKNVIFTDFIPDGQLRWLYEHTAAYIFPSLSEGFGLPGLEAMHHGAPVVSSNASCLPEVHKDAVLYFDPYDTADIAAKIQQVLDDPKLAKELARKGKKLTGTYSWDRTAKQTVAVFDKLLK